MKPLKLNSPHLIIMTGIPGAGKTYFAEHFADTFGAPMVSYQKIWTSVLGKQSSTIGAEKHVKKIASLLLGELFKTNQTIVLDGSTGTKLERKRIFEIAESKGYTPVLLWVQTDSNSAKARSIKRSAEGDYLSNDEFLAALSSFMPPTKAENTIVISGKHTYASQLKIVLKNLTENRQNQINGNSITRKLFDRHIAIR